MKKYHIIHAPYGDKRTIHIVNDDEHPIIEKIECSYYHAHKPGVGELLFSYKLDFANNKTAAIDQKFRQAFSTVKKLKKITPDYFSSSANYESAINQRTMAAIYIYIETVQTIDPIPLDAFADIMKLIPTFNVGKFLHRGHLENLVRENQHEQALQLALQDDAQGDSQIIIKLANAYRDADKLDCWAHVFSCVPETSVNFVEANAALFNYYQSLPSIADEEEKIKRVEKKFRAALNANMLGEAACFFDVLCGNTGMNPCIKKIRGDADSFIEIARERREEKKKYASLMAECGRLKDENALLKKENKQLENSTREPPVIASPASPRLF